MSDMALPKGMVCSDCMHYNRCKMLFNCKHNNTECDFAPSRFKEAPTLNSPTEKQGE